MNDGRETSVHLRSWRGKKPRCIHVNIVHGGQDFGATYACQKHRQPCAGNRCVWWSSCTCVRAISAEQDRLFYLDMVVGTIRGVSRQAQSRAHSLNMLFACGKIFVIYGLFDC
jgi:hypothetical protein